MWPKLFLSFTNRALYHCINSTAKNEKRQFLVYELLVPMAKQILHLKLLTFKPNCPYLDAIRKKLFYHSQNLSFLSSIKNNLSDNDLKSYKIPEDMLGAIE